MKSISKLILFLFLAFFLIINSCKKDFSDQNEPAGNPNIQQVDLRDENPGVGATILGQKLNNPYALTIIKQAYSNMYSQTIPNLLPTHLYVRFLPSTPQELSLLTLIVWNIGIFRWTIK